MPSPITNYAEQVLREEAERVAANKATLKGGKNSYANVHVDNDNDNDNVMGIAKVNLKDEDSFPALGKAKVKVSAPVWTNSKVTPTVIKSSNTATTNATTTNSIANSIATKTSVSSNSSIRFLLLKEHQRKDLNLTSSLYSTCTRVMKETGTNIEVSVSSQNKAISFVVSGKATSIQSARRHLWSMLAQNGTIEFEVPEECLRFIIGPSGKVLKEIETSSATKIKILSQESIASVSITGDFEGVAMARDKILSIVQERTNKTSIQLEIEKTLAPFLWTEELSSLTISKLNESFPNVKINLIKNGGEVCNLNLSGDKNQIEEIKLLISGALIRLRSLIKSVSTRVPKSLHRLLIGPKGTILHQFEESTGCGITFPVLEIEEREFNYQNQKDQDQVIVYGPEDKLLNGLSALMEKVKGLASEKILIPEISFKLIQKVQKYRNEIKSLDSEVSVYFSDISNNDNNNANKTKIVQPFIEVDGKRENVLKFISELNLILKKLSTFNVFDSLKVDEEYLKHVIGRKGQNLQQIQKEFDVEILIEEDDELVSFIGTNLESVQKAKEYVNGILSSVIDVLTLQTKIDSKYHGILIGSKGTNLKIYNEKYPSVMINFSSKTDADLVTFKGPRNEVEACQKEVLAKVDSIRHENIMNSYTQSLGKINEKLLKSNQDCVYLSNFARQNECKLIIDKDSLSITLQGCKRAVDLTLPLLKEQLENILNRDTLNFSIDQKYHGILIGAEGRNLKHLMQKYSVKVDFPKRIINSTEQDDTEIEVKTENAVDLNVIKITGPKGNILKARDELLDLLKYHQEHDHHETLKVPSKAVSFIIGKNGAVIDDIKIETDCDIEIGARSKSSEDGEEVEITQIKFSGTKKSIASAIKRVNSLVEEFIDQLEIAIPVPSNEFLKALTQGPFKREYRKVTMKQEGLVIYLKEASIKVKGKKLVVERIVSELNELISQIESKELIEVELIVPSKFHGKILGVSGSTIKSLITEFDCDIQIPRPGQGDQIKLIGKVLRIKGLSEKIGKLCALDLKIGDL